MSEHINTLYTNDNLFILHGMNSASVDLIYLDPPFNSKRTYAAPVGSRAAGASFKDMWSWADVNEHYLEKMLADYPFLVGFIQAIEGIHGKPMMAYITYMTQRLIEMHRVLKDTGSFYIHVDPTASHYIKVVCDRIFGKSNFRNEIVWCYHGPGSPRIRQFNRKSDTIFWYSKGSKWTFNKDAVRIPHKDAGPHTGGYGIDKELSLQYGKKGKVPENWWVIRIAARSPKEYTGYPTQKPLALLHRIIRASSNEGDVVFDPFCGCATACVAAEHLGRKWIGIDIEEQAAHILIERLSDESGVFKSFVHRTDIPRRTDIRLEPPSASVRERLYKTQKGVCNGCGNHYQQKDFHVDHIVPKAKGGGDYYENYQLLCGNCNAIKGDRPMAYLAMKIRRREDLLRSTLTFGGSDNK